MMQNSSAMSGGVTSKNEENPETEPPKISDTKEMPQLDPNHMDKAVEPNDTVTEATGEIPEVQDVFYKKEE